MRKRIQRFEVWTDQPFTAYDPIEGLTAWGPYSAKKEIIRDYRDKHGYRCIHFRFITDGLGNPLLKKDQEERIVKLLKTGAAKV
jgi:hypothetical protein